MSRNGEGTRGGGPRVAAGPEEVVRARVPVPTREVGLNEEGVQVQVADPTGVVAPALEPVPTVAAGPAREAAVRIPAATPAERGHQAVPALNLRR